MHSGKYIDTFTNGRFHICGNFIVVTAKTVVIGEEFVTYETVHSEFDYQTAW